MQIIDFHTHFFPDDLAPKAIDHIVQTSPGAKNRTDGTLRGLHDSMKRARIDLSVTLQVATKPSHVRAINQQVAEAKADQLIIPFGSLHPLMQDSEKEIEYLRSNGIRGIKLHPEYQYFHIDDRSMYPIYEQLANAGLIVVFHTGKDPGPFTCDHALPGAVKRVHRDFPRLKMIAAHMGGWKLWEKVETELSGEEIWFDTSAVNEYMNREDFVRLCRKHGTERILFGSDTPWYDQKEAVEWIQSSSMSSYDIEKILYKNGSELLGI
ncbi:amidohydrolase family protein [Chitinispirillum alkaliphilum]|nr:amidohydrolase family protein [Chitinispirillum alkaliphilum]